jgi:hypothetical protein
MFQKHGYATLFADGVWIMNLAHFLDFDLNQMSNKTQCNCKINKSQDFEVELVATTYRL